MAQQGTVTTSVTRALLTPPDAASTVAVPPPTAVIVVVAPVAVTETTWLLVLTHVMVRPFNRFPDLSYTEAESVMVAP
jgi:hypothetical protein